MISLYDKPGGTKLTIPSDDGYNPFTVTFNGSTGGAIVKRVYVRNDEVNKYYTSLTLTPYSAGAYIDNSQWNWKLIISDTRPTHSDWINTSAGTVLSLSDLGSSTQGDTYTYISVWVRVEVPSRQPAQNIKNIYLRLEGEENLVS